MKITLTWYEDHGSYSDFRIKDVEMVAVPRKGDFVNLDNKDTNVHKVKSVIFGIDGTVRVDLRD